VCFGYPLKGQGANGKLRDAVLRELTTPILFVQGTRDPLCPLELLANVRQQMRAPNELHVVEHGNHSLEVTRGELKRSGRTQADVDREILSAIRAFVQSA
jgi:predicted alpha/beta-hydrolase family hydrolase